MAHRIRLARLSLSIVEGAAQLIALLAADHVHRVPEVGRPHLVRDVLEHANNLSTLDLIEELTAELGVVALLIDREGALAYYSDTAIGRGDQIFERLLRVAREQRDVRHTLKLDVLPRLRIGTAVRARWLSLFLVPPIQPRRLFARGLDW